LENAQRVVILKIIIKYFLFFQAAAKKLANAKFSMGAAGNLGSLPFIDQL
jgi:hypothetical protein